MDASPFSADGKKGGVEHWFASMYNLSLIHICLRSSAPLAQFMGYYLSFILDNVYVVTSGINDILEQIFHIEQGDMLLGISFPRYSRRTVDGMRYARERGATVAAVTDSATSPLASLAEHTLMVKSDIASFVDSLVAPFSVMNALIVAIAMKKRTAVADHFKTLEDIWGQYHVCLLYTSQALIVGNEAAGVRAEVAQAASHRFRLAMAGRAESLNAAVAAGIMIYALARRMGRL